MDVESGYPASRRITASWEPSEGAQVTVQLLATAPELVEKAIVSSAVHPHVNFY